MGNLTTSRPVLLLPLRFETRFVKYNDDEKWDFWVRVYPDKIFVDTHEPALSTAEKVAGKNYHDQVAGLRPRDKQVTRSVWRELACRRVYPARGMDCENHGRSRRYGLASG